VFFGKLGRNEENSERDGDEGARKGRKWTKEPLPGSLRSFFFFFKKKKKTRVLGEETFSPQKSRRKLIISLSWK
jgi:hypothetical protein